MTPGKIYTAEDGAMVQMQLLMQDLEPWSDGMVYRPRDGKLRDVRLLLVPSGGTAVAIHPHSVSRVEDHAIVTMFGDVPWWAAKEPGIIQHPDQWTGPLNPHWGRD